MRPRPAAGAGARTARSSSRPTPTVAIFKVPARRWHGGGRHQAGRGQEGDQPPLAVLAARRPPLPVLRPDSTDRERAFRRQQRLGGVDRRQGSEVAVPGRIPGAYAPPGYVLFWREGSLVAQKFDAGKQSLLGDAFPVAEGVQRLPSRNFAFFSISSNGLLTYQGGALAGLSQLAWYDRNGRELEKISAPADVARPRLSHDGKRLAIDIRDPQSGNGDVWIYEFARKTLTRFTFDAALDLGPVWSPDDSFLAFASNRKGAVDVYRKPVAGAGAEELLLEGPADESPQSWSNDGRSLLLESRNGANRTRGGGEVWSYSFADHKAAPFLASEFNAGEPVFSPDGRFVVYVSAESGRFEIYVAGVSRSRWQVAALHGGRGRPALEPRREGDLLHRSRQPSHGRAGQDGRGAAARNPAVPLRGALPARHRSAIRRHAPMASAS